MTRDYGRVHSNFWNSADIRSLDDDGRILALYLLTNPHSNAIGAYLLPDSYIADDLQWSLERVRQTLCQTVSKGFCKRFRDGRHIVICSHLKWNPIENPNVAKAALKQCEQIPTDDPAFQCVFNGLERYRDRFGNDWETVSKRYGKPFRIPKPYPKPKPEPKPKPGPKPEPEPNLPSLRSDDGFEDWWRHVPKKVEKQAARKAFDAILKKGASTFPELMNGIQRYAAACEGKEPKFIKHPTTWLSKGCWSDEEAPETERHVTGAMSAVAGIWAGYHEDNENG
jgi:hypothetical protein